MTVLRLLHVLPAAPLHRARAAARARGRAFAAASFLAVAAAAWSSGARSAAPEPAPEGRATALSWPVVGSAPAEAADGGPEHGLTVAIQPADAQGDERREVGLVRLLALAVPAGTRFSSLAEPGPFRAVFTGEIEVEVRDRFTFHFEGTGELKLEVAGKVVLEGRAPDGGRLTSSPVRLAKGRNAIRAEYRSPDAGDARLRVLWSTAELPPEPIPPQVLFRHAGEGGDAVRARRARAEVERLQCMQCHAPARGPRAPDLRAAGERLAPGFVFAWLLDPVRQGRAPRQMPHFFAADPTGRQQAADVTAFLATSGTPSEGSTVRGDAAMGGRLFAELGCVGCHPRPGTKDAGERVALDHVAHKWRPNALASYLRAPQHVDPAAAMPDFALSEAEAAALAAFLLREVEPMPAPPEGDAARGAELVERLGCAACHALPEANAPQAPPWSELRPREAADDLCGGPPRYPTSELPLAELLAVRADVPWFEAAEAAVASLRCAACHARDADTDAWSRHAGEVADLLPPRDPAHAGLEPSRPSLTWAGEKLTASWLRGLLTGTHGKRARPWLAARMPAFPAHAEVLTRGLACAHGVPLESEAPAPADELAPIGADLVSAEKGFACVACHGVAGKPPLQVFEVQGIDFALAAQRLRYDFFQRWMHNPQRIDPSSKMPRYVDPRGKTAFVTVFGGDAQQQFAAMWAWFATLR